MWTPLVIMCLAGVLLVVRWSGAVHGPTQWGVSVAATLALAAAMVLAWRQVRAHRRIAATLRPGDDS